MHRRSSRSLEAEGPLLHPGQSRDSAEARQRTSGRSSLEKQASLEKAAVALRRSSLERLAREKSDSSSGNSRSTGSEKEKALVT